MPEPVLAVADLHTYYGDSHVLQGVSLGVAPGEVVALLGRNGMGKTTLIRSDRGIHPAPPGPGALPGRRHHRVAAVSPDRARAWRWCRRGGASSPR